MRRPVTAARRYAEAAFQIASRDDAVDEWQERLDQLAALMADDRVQRLAGNPALPLEERERVLREALAWRAGDAALNLVRLLLHRGRLGLASAIAREYRRLVQRARGIVPAVVTSASELSEPEQTAVRERLEAMTGQSVQMTVELDPDLIGGVVVRIGDHMIDASVRGRLERLRDQLVAGPAGYGTQADMTSYAPTAAAPHGTPAPEE
jgi:F-type H+-transporting ATPase subunit delta